MYAMVHAICLRTLLLGQSVNEANHELQGNLNDVGYWYQRNTLMINTLKLNIMLIKGKKHVPEMLDVNIYVDKLNQVSEVKYYGVYLEKNSSSYTHLKKLHGKIMSQSVILRRLS